MSTREVCAYKRSISLLAYKERDRELFLFFSFSFFFERE